MLFLSITKNYKLQTREYKKVFFSDNNQKKKIYRKGVAYNEILT